MARRLNTRFAMTLFLICAGAVVALILAQKYLVHEQPQQYAEAARQAMADHNWDDAATNFRLAAAADPQNPECPNWLVKYGEAIHLMLPTHPELASQDRAAYEQALEVKPDYAPALQHLVEYWMSKAQNGGTAESFRAARDYIDRLLKSTPVDDPNTQHIQSLLYITTLDAWAAGVDTDPKTVDDCLSAMRVLMEKMPADPDLPYNIAKAKITQAKQLAAQAPSKKQSDEVSAMFAEAPPIFELALVSQDKNAGMHYRFAQILQTLSVEDRADPAVQTKFRERANVEIARALALAKPTEPLYLDINIYAERLAANQGDVVTAEKILRQLQALKPDDPSVQLILAELLGQSADTRGEAVRMLENLLAAARGGGLTDDAQYFALLQLTGLRINDYADARTPAQQKQALDQIRPALAQLKEKRGETVPIAKLEARMLLLDGQAIQVIQLLTPMIASDKNAAGDMELIFMLADACRVAHQTGKATEYLQELLKNRPDFLPAHEELVQIQLEESPSEAGPELKWLRDHAPADPAVIKLWIQYFAKQKDKDPKAIRQAFDLLAELTPADQAEKARVAIIIRFWDDAIRLLSSILAKNPDDLLSTVRLSQVYALSNHVEKGLALARSYQSRHPDNPDIKMLVSKLSGATDEQLREIRRDMAEQNPDKFQKEIDLAGLSANVTEQEKHLKAAESLHPNDPDVWHELFMLYVQHGRFDDAAVYLPGLAAANKDEVKGKLYQFLLASSRGDNTQAMAIARDLTRDYPEFAMSWVSLAKVLQAQGSYDDAVSRYAVALDKQSENSEALEGIIDCLYALNRPTEAKRYIDEACHAHPNNDNFRNRLINYQVTYGNPDEAIVPMQEQIDRSEDSPILQAKLAQVYLTIAQKKLTAGKQDEFAKALDQARTILAQAQAKWPDSGDVYATLANTARLSNNLAEAEKILRQWAERDPWRTRPEPHLMLAQLYAQSNHPELAIEEYRTALARSNYPINIELELASLLVRLGKYDDALQILHANSEDPDIRRATIQVLINAGRTDEAEHQLKEALDQKPHDAADLLTIWGDLYCHRNDLDHALEKLNQALEINPVQLKALTLRAGIWLQKTPPDPDKALADLTIAREKAPDDADVLVNIARAHIDKNEMESAIRELEIALKQNPSSKGVRLYLVDQYAMQHPPRYLDAMRLLEEAELLPQFSSDPDIFQKEAILAQARGDYDRALEKNAAARKLAPDNLMLVRSYLEILLASKQYQEVLNQTDPLLQQPKQTWWIFEARAAARKNLGDKAGALADYNHALALAGSAHDSESANEILQNIAKEIGIDQAIASVGSPAQGDLATELELIFLYQRKGDQAKSMEYSESVMAGLDKLTPPEQLAALKAAGVTYAASGTPDGANKAYEIYKKALERSPDDITVLNNLACLLADSFSPPRLDEGSSYIQHATDVMDKLGEVNPIVLDTQGWLMILSGRVDEGVSLLQTVIDRKPFPQAYYHLGEGYLRLALPEQALKEANLAQTLLDKSRKEDESVDLELGPKIDDLISRSQQMMKLKPEPNVP